MEIKITKVEVQKKDNTRFNLYTEEGYLMSASAENLAPYGYKEFSLTFEELRKLELAEQRGLAYKMASRYVSRNMKTTKEARDYLGRKDIDAELQDEIIEYLEDLGLLNDQMYLELFVEDRYNLSTDGSYKIKNRLIQKGFDSSEIDPLLEQYKEQERENLNDLIKMRKQNRKDEDPQKLLRYLANKGYSYPMIKDELSIIDE